MAAVPKLTRDQVVHVSQLMAEYISAQREKCTPRAIALTAQQRAPLNPFFSDGLLDNVRVLVLEGERIPNPDFYPMLRGLGFTNLPDQSGMAAITFCDVVVSHEQLTAALLFHELVHVEQFRQLGVAGFSDRYVHGFLTGGSYDAIPLEVNAYKLEDRFRRYPRRTFSVQTEVAHWLAEQ